MVSIRFLTSDKRKYYNIEVQSDATVEYVKHLAAETIGYLEESSIMLIHNGKILSNETIINSLNIEKLNTFIVFCENKEMNNFRKNEKKSIQNAQNTEKNQAQINSYSNIQIQSLNNNSSNQNISDTQNQGQQQNQNSLPISNNVPCYKNLLCQILSMFSG